MSGAWRSSAVRWSIASRRSTIRKGRCSASSCRAAPRSRSPPRDDLFDGVVTLTADAVRLDDGDWGDTLYRTEQPAERPATLTALPYYLWNNRQKGSMMVWLVEA